MRSRLHHLGACGLLSLSLVCTRPARAAGDEDLQQVGTMMWVITVAELAVVVTVAGLAGAAAADVAVGGPGNIGRLFGNDLGLALVGTPLILGIGAGYASMEDDWDPRVAGAMHQGMWTGSALAAWGAVLGHALGDQTAWPAALAAVGLGLLGVAGGAALGGFLVDSETEVWMVYAAPAASAGAVLGAALVTLLVPELQGETAPRDWELATILIAAGTAPLLVAALGVGAISVLQAVE